MDAFGYLKAIISNDVDGKLSLHCSPQITILAVLHHQVIINLIPKTILQLHDIPILERVVNFFLILIEGLVALPNSLENLGF